MHPTVEVVYLDTVYYLFPPSAQFLQQKGIPGLCVVSDVQEGLTFLDSVTFKFGGEDQLHELLHNHSGTPTSRSALFQTIAEAMVDGRITIIRAGGYDLWLHAQTELNCGQSARVDAFKETKGFAVLSHFQKNPNTLAPDDYNSTLCEGEDLLLDYQEEQLGQGRSVGPLLGGGSGFPFRAAMFNSTLLDKVSYGSLLRQRAIRVDAQQRKAVRRTWDKSGAGSSSASAEGATSTISFKSFQPTSFGQDYKTAVTELLGSAHRDSEHECRPEENTEGPYLEPWDPAADAKRRRDNANFLATLDTVRSSPLGAATYLAAKAAGVTDSARLLGAANTGASAEALIAPKQTGQVVNSSIGLASPQKPPPNRGPQVSTEVSTKPQKTTNEVPTIRVDDTVVPITRVSSPGNRANLFSTFDSAEKVPLTYRSDPRFESLASDPAHANQISVGSRREAMAGLEAESIGLMKAKIQRGPAEIEFFDSNGTPFDVKTPPSAVEGQRDFFNATKTGKSLLRQVDKQFPNKITGTPENVKVILDSTYLNQANHKALWDYLNKNATPEQLDRIIEVNVKL